MRRQLGLANTLPHPLKALDKNKFENVLDFITIFTHKDSDGDLCLETKE